MWAILSYSGITGKTGRWLARELRIQHFNQRNLPQTRMSVIRWGNACRLWYSPPQVVNPRTAILEASNKLGALKRLQDAGVSVPPFVRICDGADYSSVLPGLARTASHYGGKGLQYVESAEDIPLNFDYVVKYIDKRAEFRVHVGEFGDVELRYLQRKLRLRDMPPAQVWNYKHGYRFHTRAVEDYPHVMELGITAVRALGLHFGAVDVIMDRDGRLYVLEVNTAPGLKSEPSQEAYLTFFRNIIG